jgi:hypothetical protein
MLSRNGQVFIGIMIFVAFMAEKLMALFTGALWTLGAIFGVAWIATQIKSSTKTPMPDSERYFVMNQTVIPLPLANIQEFVMVKLRLPTDKWQTYMGRFLGAINATDGSAVFPTYLQNGVAKKILWQYYRKFGSLTYDFQQSGTLSVDEVLSPLKDDEKILFHEFCITHSR